MKIWLADLTYTQQSIASDVVPPVSFPLLKEFVEKNETYVDEKKFVRPIGVRAVYAKSHLWPYLENLGVFERSVIDRLWAHIRDPRGIAWFLGDIR